MSNIPVVDLEDDRPIAQRLTRRGSTSSLLRDSQPKIEITSQQVHGIATPPATPHRAKKRVRFSEPGSSSTTGLTPFFCRSSISSPPPSRSRRHSTPSNRWNLSVDDSPIISGTLQFAPLRQVLEGRVKRRLRRHRLSEEVNIIQLEELVEKKSRKTEIERLKEELRHKDQEIGYLKDEQDVASQIGVEAGVAPVETTQTSARVRDLEHEIALLKAELQRREGGAETQNDPDWTMAAQDPFEEDAFMLNDDEDFNAEMTDMFHSTPGRRSFPSPPDTMPNTPSKSVSREEELAEAAVLNAEKLHLESQLQTLQQELNALNKSLELTSTTHERLTAKLSPFLDDIDSSENIDSLDAALDAVLTQLALAQSSAIDNTTRYSALTTELCRLFPSSSSSPPAPDAILSTLHKQFRSARLELEYLYPGENPHGFDNTKLLDMLVSRLRILTKKVAKQDADIDQYHSLETSLRQQLNSRIDAMTHLQTSLTTATSSIATLTSDLEDRDESIAKLTQALQSYRDEVTGLETLITRLESEHSAELARFQTDLSTLQKETASALLTSELERETARATAEGREMMMHELSARLAAALESSKGLAEEITAFQKELGDKMSALRDLQASNAGLQTAHIDLQEKVGEMKNENFALQTSATVREQEHGDALALRDARVAELRTEVEDLGKRLRDAYAGIQELRRAKGELEKKVEEERVRGSAIVDKMRTQLASALEMGEGYLSQAGSVAGSTTGDDTADVATFANTGTAVDGNGNGNAKVGNERHNPEGGVNAPVVKPGRYFDAGLARRGSKSKKRRRYDSGLGFLQEEEE